MSNYHCEQCGKEIVKLSCNKGRFCDLRCYGDYLTATKKGIPRPEVSGPKPHLQKRVAKICEKCGKEFMVKQSSADRRKCCSKECQRNQRVLECLFCHQNYSVKAAEADRSKFCSVDCRDNHWRTIVGPDNPKWKRIETPCAQCGNPIFATPSSLENKENRFCSYQCMGDWRSENLSGENSPGWLGGRKTWRGVNWETQRQLALVRDNHTCQRCGITQEELGRGLDVHHIKPFRKFGPANYVEANNLSNLTSLCQRCHMITEHQPVLNQP